MSHNIPLPIRHELWRRGDLSWKLHSGQTIVYDHIQALPPHVREVLVFISRRWGKSFLGVILALQDCLQNPGKRIAIVGPTVKQTREIVKPIIGVITGDAPKDLIRETKSELLWNVGDSQLKLGGFDSALESFRGLDLFNIYLEETGLARAEHYEYTMQSVLRPTLMHSRGRIIHLTTPAQDIEHPLHTITIPKTQKSDAFYQFTIRDNPLLTEAEIEEEIRELGGLDSVHTRRELFCEIVRDSEVIVCPEFSEERHVKPQEIPKFHNVWVGGDAGGVRDKTVALLAYFNPETKKVQIVDERVFDNNTPSSVICKQSLEMEKNWDATPEVRYFDAPGQLRIDWSTEHGYDTVFPKKEEFDAGILMLRNHFRYDMIEIDPRCKFLIQSLRSGMFNDKRTDFARTPMLGHCDGIASLIYTLRWKDITNPTPPLHNINTGESVGWEKLTEVTHSLENLIPEYIDE